MTASHLSRLAGPAALTAGALLVIGELIIWPFDTSDHVATSTNTVFQLGQVVYLLGFVGLMVFLFASSRRQDDEGGRFGVVATLAALIGTMALGGDLWFETFAVPWLADEAPAAFATDPTAVLALGAISSYLLFAIGWALFGIANLRSGVYPKVVSAMIVVGGIVGFQALLSPYGVPLGLAIGAAGVWLLRQGSGGDAEATTSRDPQYIG
jgi:hypothetical protein